MTQQRTASHDGVAIHYTAEGEGYPIVIVPSLGRGPADYDELARLLAEQGFKVVRPVPRGLHGSGAGAAGADLTLHDYARDVAAVIRLEGNPDAIIAGHALGNFIARTTAADFPDLVRGVALLAASAGKAPQGQTSIPADVLESVYQSGNLTLSDEERLTHLQKAFFAPGNDPRVWLTGWYPELKTIQNAAWRATPIDDYFAAGSAPLLDLQALQDTVAPRAFSHVLKEALGGRVTVAQVDRAGHALIPEQPQAVARALCDWAAGLLAPPAGPGRRGG